MLCGQPRKLLRSSSGAKSFRDSHVPASSPTTSIPACASGSAATPPAAPRPTITTSVSLSLVAIVVISGLGEFVLVGRLVDLLQRLRLQALLIRRADHRADARIVDEIPADVVRVAAVKRIAE